MALLDVKNLCVDFHTDQGTVHAVRDISFSVGESEAVGIVGESGSGKSVTMYSVMGLLAGNGSITGGSVSLNGQEITESAFPDHKAYEAAMDQIRGNQMAMIFQDPMTALNPVMTVGDQIGESIAIHQNISKKEAFEKAKEMLKMVGIAESRAYDYPHQFSGGMKQRVVIAIALACSPQLLIADEPTTALDVTIQAQVLELMKQLIRDKEMSMLMITHDLGVVAEVCEDVAVMYAGRIVEKGTADDVFNHMRHPYTEGLFDSLPNLKQRGEELVPIKGLMPDPSDLPPGCAFAPRCPYATEACTKAVPELTSVEGSATHFVACSAYKDPEFRLGENKDGR